MLDCRCYGQHSRENESRTEIRREPFIRAVFVLDKTCSYKWSSSRLIFPRINGLNVTRQSYFFNPSSTYLRLNENPECFYKLLLFFFGSSVYVYFRSDLQYSLSILTLQYKHLNLVSSYNWIGHYFTDNIFVSFIKSYGRQVFPHEKEVKVLLIYRFSIY